MRIGAGLGNMREAWWVPMIDVARPDGTTVAWQVNGERSRPHSIMVNRKGRRFTDEAANYNALGAAFHVLDVTEFDYVNHPAWLVVDDFYLSRYGLAGFRSGAGRATPELARRGAVGAGSWRPHRRARRRPAGDRRAVERGGRARAATRTSAAA